MQFYDATNNQGLCQEVDRLCDTTDTTYPRVAKTSRINNAYETVVGWLLASEGSWDFDDSNYTDLPVGTATLVEGQESYTFASDYLQILGVKVKDAGGTWQVLKPIDEFKDIHPSGTPIEEYFADTGLPEYYDLVAEDTIRLYPAPTSTSVTLTNGLKVNFRRTASTFTVASNTNADTKTPGFASPFHVILAYMASVPYCAIYHADRVQWLTAEVQRLKSELLTHYARRNREDRPRLQMKPISHR